MKKTLSEKNGLFEEREKKLTLLQTHKKHTAALSVSKREFLQKTVEDPYGLNYPTYCHVQNYVLYLSPESSLLLFVYFGAKCK